jgi:hypothetical protein
MKKTNYKIKLALLGAVIITACSCFLSPVDAYPNPGGSTFFGVAGQTNGGTNMYAVVPQQGTGNGQAGTPIITFLNAQTDNPTNYVRFWNVTNECVEVLYTNSTTSLYVSATNTTIASSVVLIYHKANGIYEKRFAASYTGLTNVLVLANATQYAVNPGDIIWSVSPGPTLGVGTYSAIVGLANGTNYVYNFSGTEMYAGQPGLPLLIDIPGTNAATLSLVAGRYAP